MSTRPALIAALFASFQLACATLPHTELPVAPTADDPYEERSDYYRKHSPSLVNFSEQGYLLLHGGTRLYWPEDLLPAVAPDSPTAFAINEHVTNRETSDTIYKFVTFPGYVVLLGGSVAMSIGLVMAMDAVDHDFATTFIHPYFLVPTGVTAAGLGAAMVGMILQGEPARLANESLVTIIATYPQSLEDRLGVHANADGDIVDTSARQAPPVRVMADDKPTLDI